MILQADLSVSLWRHHRGAYFIEEQVGQSSHDGGLSTWAILGDAHQRIWDCSRALEAGHECVCPPCIPRCIKPLELLYDR
jgi:hypothetical protein